MSLRGQASPSLTGTPGGKAGVPLPGRYQLTSGYVDTPAPGVGLGGSLEPPPACGTQALSVGGGCRVGVLACRPGAELGSVPKGPPEAPPSQAGPSHSWPGLSPSLPYLSPSLWPHLFSPSPCV